jgi:hypothetical protein
MTATGSRSRVSRLPERHRRLIEALWWMAFGAAISIAAWRMPRLEALHIPPWSAPGLLPGVIGLLMIAFGLVTGLARGEVADGETGAAAAGRGDADSGRPGSGEAGSGEAGGGESTAGESAAGEAAGGEAADPGRTGIGATIATLVLCLGYAAGLVGRMPFVLASTVFVFAFITWFGWPTWRREGGTGRGAGVAAAVAVAASTLFSWLFESVFLVRLP